MKIKNVIATNVAVSLILLIMVSCTTTASYDNKQVHDDIVAANKKFMTAFENSDDLAMASLYTSDAKLMPTNSDFVSGNQAVQAFWKSVFDMGLKKATLETVEVEAMGDNAWEVGKYSLFIEGDQLVDSGKYLVAWKKVDGEWKLHRDIWNTSMPAQP